MPLGARGLSRRMSPLHSEMEALLWAMSCILEQELDCHEFETYCFDLEEWPAFSIFSNKFREMHGRFPHFSLTLISYSFNLKADCMARSARTRTFEFSVVNNSPHY